MPLIIIDSDILIDFSRGDEIAAKWLDNTALESTLAISVITEMELMVGSRNKDHFNEIRRFLSRFQLLNISEQISERTSDLIQEYHLSHGLLIPDAIIAATALTFDASLATRNQRDFKFINELNLLSYPDLD